jgi:hypothetical protein
VLFGALVLWWQDIFPQIAQIFADRNSERKNLRKSARSAGNFNDFDFS